MRGFTIAELVVIVIAGILAVVALPRMFSRISVHALRFHDDAQAAVRCAQKLAIAGLSMTNVGFSPAFRFPFELYRDGDTSGRHPVCVRRRNVAGSACP
jgi:hypothetical protein